MEAGARQRLHHNDVLRFGHSSKNYRFIAVDIEAAEIEAEEAEESNPRLRASMTAPVAAKRAYQQVPQYLPAGHETSGPNTVEERLQKQEKQL